MLVYIKGKNNTFSDSKIRAIVWVCVFQHQYNYYYGFYNVLFMLLVSSCKSQTYPSSRNCACIAVFQLNYLKNSTAYSYIYGVWKEDLHVLRKCTSLQL